MIAYSIELSKRIPIFKDVIVSTDDEEIAKTSRKYGARVPFMRSPGNSDDFSGPGDVLYEVLNRLRSSGETYDTACCIYATAPFLKEETLLKAKKLLEQGDFDVVFPLVRYASPIQRSYRIDGNEARFNFPEYVKSRSQDLPDAYYDAGQFYYFRIPQFNNLENKNVFGLRKGAIIIPENEAQDIDEPEDWKSAEVKYKTYIQPNE